MSLKSCSKALRSVFMLDSVSPSIDPKIGVQRPVTVIAAGQECTHPAVYNDVPRTTASRSLGSRFNQSDLSLFSVYAPALTAQPQHCSIAHGTVCDVLQRSVPCRPYRHVASYDGSGAQRAPVQHQRATAHGRSCRRRATRLGAAGFAGTHRMPTKIAGKNN